MRILLKIVLFPVSVASLVLLPCKFMCLFGTMLLSVLSFIIFTVALLTMMFLAYLISPYGIPLAASWLIGVVDSISERMRMI